MKRRVLWLILGMCLLAWTALAAAQTTDKPETPPPGQPTASTADKPAAPTVGQPAAKPDVPPEAPPGRLGRERKGARHGRFYDPSSVETLTGEVIKVQRGSLSKRGKRDMVRFTLKAGKETIKILLGPALYVDSQALKLAVGDKVEVKGFRKKLPRRGKTVFAATTVRKGNQILKLRDEQGKPLWPRPRGRGRRGKRLSDS